MLHRLPDLKYFCGGVSTVGNLPDDCWPKEQSLPEPLLCFPQAFLQRPLRNRQRPTPKGNAFRSPGIRIALGFFSLTSGTEGRETSAASFALSPLPTPPLCNQSLRPYTAHLSPG